MNNSVAVVAAHPDDEVLGCGGTLARMASEGRAVHILLLADGESSRPEIPDRGSDANKMAARKAAAENACKVLGCSTVEILMLPDNRLDSLVLLDVVRQVEKFLLRHQPSTVFTHHAGDVNVDHQVVHHAVITACRPLPEYHVRELLFFEVPSSTEWRPAGSAAPFVPNWFVDISATMAKKLKALEVYETELRAFPHPRSLQAVSALAAWRGATVGVDAAEAFMLGRKVID
ncbi:MAG: PIG-L family deacetylase [Polaromonas sp.]|uniref:PIG-L deacetylase family protein n=1 Tax=Polaromonas sp. TaxID=1869339 RepID=UPI002487390E|nr:PIG-L deacetylase family protein [Polaromonas sp.]MDI1270409.1 PIG-L family deacetylase [Polaromonas sp.]